MSVKKFTDARDMEWFVEGIAAKGAVTLLVADSGVGKSVLCMQLSACIKSGRPFMGLECKQGEVLWVEQDESPSGVKNKIEKMMGHSPELIDLEYFGELWSPVGPSAKDDIRDLTESMRGRDVLIIDAWEAIGLKNQNNNMEIAEALRNLRMVIGHEFVSVIIISHFNKKTDYFRSLEDRISGGLTLLNGCDTCLFLQLQGGAEPKKRTLRPSTKFRGDRKFQSILMDFDPVNLEFQHKTTIKFAWQEDSNDSSEEAESESGADQETERDLFGMG